MDFNAEKEVSKIIEFIRNYYKENNLKGVVIGISGGKDSAVASALFVKALGAENVLGITLPCNSKEEDKEDAKLIADFYNFRLINIDLTNVYNTFKNEIDKLGIDSDTLIDSNINLKPRLRMSALYYVAAMETKIKNETYIVAGTSNKSENYVGYFTKGGDSVSDIRVLSDFTVSEVIKIGEVLNVPKKVLYKTPSDGLSNLSDEDKLGVTYDSIERFINGENIDELSFEKIKKLHQRNRHKFDIATYTK